MSKILFINRRKISQNNPPLIVAEISANHQNSLNKTLKLLKKAADAGVEAVKFQTYDLNEMTLNINKNEFLIQNKFKNKEWNSRSLYSIYKETRFPYKWHKHVFKKAKSLGMICFSSVFDEKSLNFLEKLKCPAYKIASLESLHFPLIKKVVKTNKTIIISTGTLNRREIDTLMKFLKKIKSKKHIILHCISDYPTKNKDVNLKFISFLIKKYNCLSGFSDHTSSIGAAISSVAFGACLIEKHLKLSKSSKSLDHQFSITPSEISSLILEANNAWASIGNGKKKITKGENFVKKFRRSIYAHKQIKKGEKISHMNVKIIRPGLGVSPKYFTSIMGKKVNRNINVGEPIKFNILKSS